MKLNYTFSLVLAIITMSFLLVPWSSKDAPGANMKVGETTREEVVNFKIYNDPYTDQITIFFDAEKTDNGLISVFYADGKLDGRKLVSINRGINNWEYRFTKVSTGMYFVRFATCGIEETGKVYKTVQ